MTEPLSKLGQAALDCLARGWAVIPLNSRGKKPNTINGLNDWTDDPESVRAIWEKYPDKNIGVVCGEPSNGLLVIDFDIDDDKGYDSVHDVLIPWESEHGELPETVTEVTGRGGVHYFYRTDRRIQKCENEELHVDIRAEGSYVMVSPSIHPNGNTVEWENHPDDYEIAWADDNVYALIEKIHPPEDDGDWDTFELPDGDLEEGARDKTLYRWACSMWAKNTPIDVIRAAMYAYNESHCKPPLPKKTIEAKIKSATKHKPGMSDEVKAQTKAKDGAIATRGSRGKFLHHVVGKILIEKHGACLLDGETPAIRLGNGQYKMGWDEFDETIINIDEECKISERREVKAYVKAKAPRKKQSSPMLIGFINGVLDVETLELRDWQESDVIPNMIPHKWRKEARSDLLNNMLEKISCGDIATGMNLCEFLGMCMMRSTTLVPFFPVLVGSGSNGKSTYINLISNVVGMDNISALQPETIAKHFMGVHIAGKTANLGDDIPGGFLNQDACSMIKSVATGDLMTTDVKGAIGFKFRPQCTMVFSCNAFPRLADTTDGFMRRLFPVEFNAKFSTDDPDYDPQISIKMESEEVLEAACVLGIEGLRRVLAQNHPTPNEMSESLKAEIVQEGNTGMQWFNDECITANDIIDNTKEEVFTRYYAWCERNGYTRTALGSGSLSKLIGTYFRLSCTRTDHREYSDGRKTVKVYEKKVPKGANKNA